VVLPENAWPTLDRAAHDERAVWRIRAERVVRIAGIDARGIGKATATGFDTEEDWLRRRLVDRPVH